MAAEIGGGQDEPLEGRPALVPAALEGAPTENDRLQILRAQKAELTQRKKVLSRQLRNEERKRHRLRERAKNLSNDDLVRVLAGREAQAKAKAKAKPQPVGRRG